MSLRRLALLGLALWIGRWALLELAGHSSRRWKPPAPPV
jgi:hypothetical protein